MGTNEMNDDTNKPEDCTRCQGANAIGCRTPELYGSEYLCDFCNDYVSGKTLKALVENVQQSEKFKQLTDSVAEAVHFKTAPDQPEMDFETIERIAKDLCESRRGLGAWDKKACERNHWRRKAADKMRARNWGANLYDSVRKAAFPRPTMKQRIARWVIGIFTKAAA